ncbi:MAG: ABC transporter ATP-binding protein [Halobacteriovoraceae bacterium]|nr:ABC transporter ATP-binding protein [Halobacteriovoraceae bacterium]
MSIIFEIKNVSKEYGDNDNTHVQALGNINLSIGNGEFTAIVGPSGSGKSTLLNIMSGLDNPSTGEVILKGQHINQMSGHDLSQFRRDHIGFIFQSYNLIPVLTVKENVEYIMTLQGVSEVEKSQRVKQVLEEVGIAGKEDRLPSQLSGGQQQRVAVARAIVARPDIILADEPTANLDSKTGGDLIEMMMKLNEESKTTFVFSTHDQKIMDRAKRLITLHDGVIQSDIIRS